ncbi:MAG: ATP-binding protein [Rhodoblastus sp.]
MIPKSRRFIGYNLLFLAFGALALFTIVATSVLYSSRVQTYAAEALKATRLNTQLLKYEADLVDAETAVRGFQLVGRESYLDPYFEAVSNIERDASDIRRHVDSFVEKTIDRQEIDKLLGLGEAKLAIVKTNLEAARRRELDAEALGTVSDRGKIAMDAVRAKVGDLQQAAEAIATRQDDKMREASATLTVLIALGVGMIVVLTIAAGLFIVRHLRELGRAREALVEVNTNLEERVRARTEGVMRANEELQRYAYIVSHDLRAPLVNIMGFVSELETATKILREHIGKSDDDHNDPALAQVYEAADTDIPEALGFIRSSMNRMDRLINEILKLSRAGRRVLEPKAVKMEALMQTCIDSIQQRFEDAGATVSVDGALPNIVSDPAALEQIFSNVLDNAAKYLHRDRPGAIVVRGRTKGGYAVFEIEDNGRGVAPGDQERIFELFRRAGVQDRPGEGIGLAHTRQLTRRLGGDVTVTSDGSSGTIFTVTVARDLGALLRSEIS